MISAAYSFCIKAKQWRFSRHTKRSRLAALQSGPPRWQFLLITGTRSLAALTLVLSTISCGQADVDKRALSDKEAKRILEPQLAKMTTAFLPTGQLAVMRNGFQAGKGAIDGERYQLIVSAQKAGLVKVVEDPTYKQFREGNGRFDMQLFNELSRGIDAKITVTPAELSKSQCEPMPMDDKSQWLNCTLGKATGIEIIKNEAKKGGMNEFRLILLKYRWESSPLMLASSGKPFTDLNAAFLLRWDEFAKSWSMVTFSQQEAGGQLDTSAIDAALRDGG